MQVRINNICKSFGNKTVLKDISMHVKEKEIICLLGPSGAGKTTLIRLIIGAIRAENGEILIDNTKIPNMKIVKQIGFMPQNDALYNDLTGEQNLLFFGGLFKVNKSELKVRVRELLELMNLTDDGKKLVKNYSGGMKKRLSLAVALLHKPKLLILDEPTVGIDPVLRQTIWDQFYELKKSGTTIIVSTHVMDEAEKCDKAALIYGGKLIAFDDIDKLIDKTPDGNIEELFFMAKEGKLC